MLEEAGRFTETAGRSRRVPESAGKSKEVLLKCQKVQAGFLRVLEEAGTSPETAAMNIFKVRLILQSYFS